MIKLTLENDGQDHPEDYVKVEFRFDDDAQWSKIVHALVSQGLPALTYVLSSKTLGDIEEAIALPYDKRDGN